jgi:hypothetical protein
MIDCGQLGQVVGPSKAAGSKGRSKAAKAAKAAQRPQRPPKGRKLGAKTAGPLGAEGGSLEHRVDRVGEGVKWVLRVARWSTGWIALVKASSGW